MCGEQTILASLELSALGSPPRVRGTVKELFDADGQYRITPACAGNSFHPIIVGRIIEDHPRVCGEQCPAQLL